MQYHAYELAHAYLTPMRMTAEILREVYGNGFSPLAYTRLGRSVAAACEVFENTTRRYGKPAFGLSETLIEGRKAKIKERVVRERAFCELRHFARERRALAGRRDPKVLVVAPLSGHYATLLRGTVEALLPDHEVYVTDWRDARSVPLYAGRFDLDDCIEQLVDFLQFLGPDTHVIAVCQPSVPVLAATAVMAQQDDPNQPASITLMAGPIDTRRNPTAVNQHAESKSLSWFENSVISRVPPPHQGVFRRVYPGFMQLSGFMAMNMERHVSAHMELFHHLIEGDCDSVEQHRTFYDEYRSVMDLPGEFFLQTVRDVFQTHALPDGTMTHRGRRIDCRAIHKTALMTVEGEKDDICGLGQTAAAHDLCPNIPAADQHHYVQPGVGHYGVFNGRRWREQIEPRIAAMIRDTEARHGRRG